MKRSELQYLSDTLLIEEISALEFGLTKQADLFSSLGLSGVASSIKNFVSEHVSDDAPGGKIGGVFDLLLSGALFKAHPIIGVIYQIARQMGFDINSIIKRIVESLKPKLDSGQIVTSDDVNSVGKSVIAPLAIAGAPNDLFESLRKISQNGKLQKLAAGGELDAIRRLLTPGARSATPDIPFFGGGGSLIEKIFGNLFKLPDGKGKVVWLLGGFIIWIVKTALLGAGLIAGAEVISGLIGHKKPTPEGSAYSQKSNETTETVEKVKSPVPISEPEQELWVVPLVGDGSIEDTLKIWTLDLYPNLNKYDNIEKIIESTPSFRATVALLKSDYKMLGNKSMVMPKQFSSRQQVVDIFINDVIKALG